jgi:uncharacterized protein YndB with AHSA1/START domain
MTESDFAIGPEGALAVSVTRSFHHPPEKVIWAFLDPEMIRAWMGAPEMPLEVCECDPQAGGRFRHAWALPDGTKSWVAGSFLAIEHDHMIHSEVWKPDWTGGETRVVKQVAVAEGRTHLRMQVTYATTEARNAALAAMATGLRNAWDRLEALD